MKRTAILTVILLAALSFSGFAQESEQSKPKSKGTATALAIGGIVIPVFGPGLGHLYAEQTGQFAKGAAIRVVFSGIIIACIVAWDFDRNFSISFGSKGNSSNSNADWYIPVIFASAAGYLTSAIYDIVKTDRSVERYNREHGFASIHLKPYYNPDRKFVGVNICANF